MFKNELEIDIGRCLGALIKRIRFIIIFSLIFLVIGIGLTLDPGVDMYGATATAYAAAENSYSDAANAVTAMNAYMDVAKSYKVCQRAALIIGRSDVEASDVQGAVSVGTSAKKNSSSISNFMNSSATIISFNATTTDPELSMEMADAMVQSYIMEMTDILHTDSVKALDSAYKYYKTYDAKNDTLKSRIVYMLIGFILACMIVVGSEIFDSKVRTIREASMKDNLPVIGIIPDYK